MRRGLIRVAIVLAKTPMQTFLDAHTIAQEKQIGEQFTAHGGMNINQPVSAAPSDQIETCTPQRSAF
jgi:hypothetical protein